MSLHSARWCLVIPWVLALGACSTKAPSTSADELSSDRPGYVLGYLEPAALPNSPSFLPPPPQAGSPAFTVDQDVYTRTRALRDTPRWVLAARDADLTFPNAAQAYSCALGIAVSPETTPHLNMLIRRVRADASRANDKAKALYKRQRPYLAYSDTSCTPREKHKDDSYPSGHASIGWAWALVLAEIAPDRADALFARGLSFGESRVICGVHWRSDVDAGRVVGASVVSRLHADPVFTAQLALARKEIEGARARGALPAGNCVEEAKALAIQ